MKKVSILASLVFIALTHLTCQRDMDQTAETISFYSVAENGVTTANYQELNSILAPTDNLTPDEIELIYAIVQDEKLAEDLNTALRQTYPQEIFTKVCVAEKTHCQTLQALLDYFEIEYPALSQPGTFEDPARQELYNTTLQNCTSIEQAYKLLGQIEEKNIVSYQKAQEAFTNPNITIVLENMVKMSTHHLQCYINQLKRLNVEYVPTSLTQEQIDQLLSQPYKTDCQYKTQNGQGKKHQGNNSAKCGQKQGTKGGLNNQGNCTNSSAGTLPSQGNGKNYRNRNS